jgi:hypothetical protein
MRNKMQDILFTKELILIEVCFSCTIQRLRGKIHDGDFACKLLQTDTACRLVAVVMLQACCRHTLQRDVSTQIHYVGSANKIRIVYFFPTDACMAVMISLDGRNATASM